MAQLVSVLFLATLLTLVFLKELFHCVDIHVYQSQLVFALLPNSAGMHLPIHRQYTERAGTELLHDTRSCKCDKAQERYGCLSNTLSIKRQVEKRYVKIWIFVSNPM